MTAEQILFLITAVLMIAAALMVVLTRNLIHAALWLVAVLFFVAVVYVLLQAGFLAVVQVVVYIGAIAILFIFAVMLTRKEIRDLGEQNRNHWWIPALISLLLLAGLATLILAQPGVTRFPAEIPGDLDTVQALGEALVSPNAFVLPFEIASVLLLSALVGAVYIASNPRNEEPK